MARERARVWMGFCFYQATPSDIKGAGGVLLLTHERLLCNYPYLYEDAKTRRSNLENPLRSKDPTSPRISFSKISDPTAQAGMQLYELSKLEELLKRTKRWIDGITDQRERRLLIAVWRASRCGLPVKSAAYEAELSQTNTVLIWGTMLDRFEKYIGGVVNDRYPFAC
jgi:hypothetical protein